MNGGTEMGDWFLDAFSMTFGFGIAYGAERDTLVALLSWEQFFSFIHIAVVLENKNGTKSFSLKRYS